MFEKLQKLRFRRTTMLIVACVSFLIGLALARRQWFSVPLLFIFICLCLLIAARRNKNILLISLVIITALAAGLWRGTQVLQDMAPYRTYTHQSVTLTGTATMDAIYGKNSQLSFQLNGLRLEHPGSVTLPGAVKVQGFGESMVYRGDQVRVTGKLYPTRGSAQASISYAQIATYGNKSNVIDLVRRKFAAGMQSALPEPLASFGLGLLVGQRNTLPETVSHTLLMVGLTHIIAVSGYNLTILLEAAKRLTGNRSKRLSMILALGLIGIFLLFAGSSASIVRAAVISVLSLSAWYYGRTVRPLLLIVLAAALTAGTDPVYLWSDIGWYLSFLAFFGILMVAPRLTRKICGDKRPNVFLQIAIESICAEIMTLPLVLYIFGQTSLVGLIANVAVALFIPLAMLTSLIAGIAGMAFSTVAGWFAWPAALLLTYMLDVSSLLARIPHVFQEGRYISLVDLIGLYMAVTGLLLFAHRRRRRPWYESLVLATQKITPVRNR